MTSFRPAPWQAAFIALGAIWGCSFLFIKLGLQSFTPVQVAFGRLAIGAVVLVVISAITGTRLPRRRETWRHLAALGLLFCAIPFTLFAYGETQISSVLAGIINAGTPLMTLLVTIVAFRDQRPTRAQVAGLGVGFAGVLVVIGVWQGLGAGDVAGILACVGAITCYGIVYPYTRRHLTDTGDSPIAIATGQVILGALFLVPLVAGTALIGAGGITTPVTADTILGMLALGALGSGVAYVLSLRIVIAAGPAVASSVTYLIPLFAIAAGAIFLSEPVAWYQPVGGAIVLLGVAIAQGRVRLPRRETPVVPIETA